jgi:PAS domain S-box-containing protein
MRDPLDDIQGLGSRAAAVGRSLATTIRGPVLWLTLCGGLLVTAIFVGTIMMIGEFRERALGNNERELENTVLLLTRHFDQQFEDSEAIASDVIAQLRISGIASPDMFRERMSSPDAHEILRSKAGVLSYLGDISIFDTNGNIINWSRPLPTPALDISDRTYFKTFTSDPQSEAVLAEAVTSHITGKLNSVIAHRLNGQNGVLLGVMTRRIDPANYEKFLASVAPGASATVSMFQADGTMLARYPHAEQLIGQKFPTAPLLQQVLAKGGRRTLRQQSPIDNIDRLVSGARLSRFPGAVIATNTVSAALADWRAQTKLLVAAAALAASVIAVILLLIVRQITRQNREAQQRLEAERQRLDTALNNMIQGLVLYDRSGRVVTFNRRYIDMFGLSMEVVKPGSHFRDLIQHRKDTGSFEDDVDEFCSAIMQNIAHGRVDQTIMECADGRAFVAVSKPLAHGGWVATMEDITERRKLEHERDRNQTFLRQIVNHIPTQITVKDVRDGRYVLANQVAEAQLGLPSGAIVGKTARDLFSKAAASIIAADDARALQSPDGLFLDVAPWRTEGSGQRFITSRRIGIPDQTGETRYIINVVDDVTERRRADEKDRAPRPLRRADRAAQPGAVPQADRARARKSAAGRAIRPALYRH